MAKTAEDLVTFLKARAESTWESSQQPFLLSDAGPALIAADLDYKAILGEERLKAFVIRTASDDAYRVVSHPTQKPKVGIVPAGVDFQFKVNQSGEGFARVVRSDAEYSSRAFVRALSRLSEDELDQIVIPTRIFVKLLGGR